jgi:hypothetical protein
VRGNSRIGARSQREYGSSVSEHILHSGTSNMADLFIQLIAHRQRSGDEFQFTALLVVDIGNA